MTVSFRGHVDVTFGYFRLLLWGMSAVSVTLGYAGFNRGYVRVITLVYILILELLVLSLYILSCIQIMSGMLNKMRIECQVVCEWNGN